MNSSDDAAKPFAVATDLGDAAPPAPASVLSQTRRSVRGKLIGMLLLTTAIALLIAGVAMLTYDLRVYRQTWATDISTEASILALSTAPALAFHDREAAARNLTAMRVRTEVEAAALYTPDGEL